MIQCTNETRLQRLAALTIFVLAAFATPVSANTGTPLMWVTAGQMLVGNALIGILEGSLLSRWFKVARRRAILFMIAANYVSMVPGIGLAALLGEWFQSTQTALDPLAAGRIAILLATAVAFLVTILVEWPFCMWAMKKQGWRPVKSLKASAILQAISYALLVPVFAYFCQMSAYTVASIQPDLGFVKSPGVTIYYINPDDGDIWSIKADGSAKQRAQESDLIENGARLFAMRDADDRPFDLWCVREFRQAPVQIMASIGPCAAPRPCPHCNEEPNTYWNFGTKVFNSEHIELDPGNGYDVSMQTGFRADAGFWPAEGLLVIRDGDVTYRIVLDTPFVRWLCRNVVMLPDDQVLFQMDDMLLILDMPSRAMGFLTRGRGPVAVMEGGSARTKLSSDPR